MTDANQQVTDTFRYTAFGGFSDRTGSTPTPFTWNAKSQYQADGQTGLYLLGNRYYDPNAGRFISQDPAQDESNWYAYCGNNPVNFTDPLGNVSERMGRVTALPWSPANETFGVIYRRSATGNSANRVILSAAKNLDA